MCKENFIVSGRSQLFNSPVAVILGVAGMTLVGWGNLLAMAIEPGMHLAQASPTGQANLLYVNPTIGNDNATGNAQAPLRTITQALRVATPNTVIVLAAGTYSAETGEVFPLQLKPGVTIQGTPQDRGQNVIIRGGNFFLSRTFARQNVTIVGANQAGLTGVTVTNPNPQGYGLWTESTSPIVTDNTFTGSSHDGASIVGNSAPVLRNNYFFQNGANGVTIYGTSRPELQENIFERTGFGINIAQNSAPRIIGNRITQNKDGIVIQGNAQPILRNNVIDENERDGIVAIAQSRPNLGTSTEPGNNTFLSNRQFDINTQKSTQLVPAFGNQISARTIGRLDFSGIPTAIEPPTNVASTVAFGQALPQSSETPNSVMLPTIAVTPRTNRTGRSLPQPAQPRGTAVQIPVPAASAPLPLISQASSAPLSRLNRVTPLSQSPLAIPSRSMPIEIPVPAPESGSVTPLAIPRGEAVPGAVPRQAVTQAPRRSASTPGLLPVPRATPPIGNVGNGSGVRVWRGSSQGGTRPMSNRSAFPFRIIVDASTNPSQVRAVVPDAFWTSFQGRRVMQAGAFQTRSEAEELLQILINQGLPASLVQL